MLDYRASANARKLARKLARELPCDAVGNVGRVSCEGGLSDREPPTGIPKLRTILQIFFFRSLNALAITETELKLMASAAIIGESTRPNAGYRTPAATGIPSVL